MNFEQYVLVGSTVRSYLAWLKDAGNLNAEFENYEKNDADFTAGNNVHSLSVQFIGAETGRNRPIQAKKVKRLQNQQNLQIQTDPHPSLTKHQNRGRTGGMIPQSALAAQWFLEESQ